jgi:hypothetical protein
MNKDKALKLALAALEFDGFTPEDFTHRSIHTKAITAIKQALAAPTVQEPYARIYETEGPFGLHQSLECRSYNGRNPDRVVPVYTTPHAAQRQWVGLTPHERMMCRSYDIDTAIDKTEAKLKEKNT